MFKLIFMLQLTSPRKFNYKIKQHNPPPTFFVKTIGITQKIRFSNVLPNGLSSKFFNLAMTKFSEINHLLD